MKILSNKKIIKLKVVFYHKNICLIIEGAAINDLHIFDEAFESNLYDKFNKKSGKIIFSNNSRDSQSIKCFGLRDITCTTKCIHNTRQLSL